MKINFYKKLKAADELMTKYVGATTKMYDKCINKGKKSADNILKFLVEWKTRGVTNKGKKGRKFKKDLRGVLKEIHKDYYRYFENKSIEGISLDDDKKKIEDIYYLIVKSIKGFGPTAASKVLHLLFPKLFIMWDYKIRDYYNKTGSPKSYYTFLQDMQKQAKKFAQLKHKSWVFEIKRKPTIPKLIDEYNYLICTKKWKI